MSRLADTLKRHFASEQRPHILVIGDLMLDRHIHCEVVGVSPEDDLALKLRPVRTEERLGGAANVAANLAVLGGYVG